MTLKELTADVADWGFSNTTANHSDGIWRITKDGKKQVFEYVGNRERLRMWDERDAYLPGERR